MDPISWLQSKSFAYNPRANFPEDRRHAGMAVDIEIAKRYGEMIQCDVPTDEWAENLAGMITEWVDRGMKGNWECGLARVIKLRLDRLVKQTGAEAPATQETALPENV